MERASSRVRDVSQASGCARTHPLRLRLEESVEDRHELHGVRRAVRLHQRHAHREALLPDIVAEVTQRVRDEPVQHGAHGGGLGQTVHARCGEAHERVSEWVRRRHKRALLLTADAEHRRLADVREASHVALLALACRGERISVSEYGCGGPSEDETDTGKRTARPTARQSPTGRQSSQT